MNLLMPILKISYGGHPLFYSMKLWKLSFYTPCKFFRKLHFLAWNIINIFKLLYEDFILILFRWFFEVSSCYIPRSLVKYFRICMNVLVLVQKNRTKSQILRMGTRFENFFPPDILWMITRTQQLGHSGPGSGYVGHADEGTSVNSVA